jgi:hypothetical protein
VNDIALTSEGMPAVVLGTVRYPLLLAVADVKAWAEHKDMDYLAVVEKPWDFTDLPLEDLEFLLDRALRAGELRRLMFDGAPAQAIPDDLVERLFRLAHLQEVWALIATVWSAPPARTPDPQTAPQPVGESSSE